MIRLKSSGFRLKRKNTKLLLHYCNTSILLAILIFILSPIARARVYIDITSPNPRPILIGLQVYTEDSDQLLFSPQIKTLPSYAQQILTIIKDDLTYTGLFSTIEERLFLEPPSSPFKSENWKPLGADAVVKIKLQLSQNTVKALSVIYDVNEGLQIFKKEYSGDIAFIRTLAHVLARDIYKRFTDRDPPFEAKILYVGQIDGKRSLFIIDWDGARQRRLGISAETLLSPRWNDEYRLLAYTLRDGRRWSLKTLDFNTMTQKTVLESQTLTIAGDFIDRKNLLVTYTDADNQDIYILDTETSRLKKIIGGFGIEIDPVISPDKTKFLFVSDRSGSPQIYIAELSGYNIKRLTFQGNYNTSPRWSPAGDAFVYVGSVNGRNQIFLQKFDPAKAEIAGEPEQLTSRGDNEEPSFSPDGRYITFSSNRDGLWRIYIMRIDGSGQKVLTEGYGFSPVWIK